MPRIRSVHPGLWTDERFASVSPLARLLFVGIWTECDDAGSFEWSPIKLKMRLLPADNADAVLLLEELEAAGSVLRYEVDGRQFGAVRNFVKYQRPKKPNSLYPQTTEVRNYCGHKGEEVPNQFPTGGEKAPQMEDGGGRRSSEPNGSALVDPEKAMFDSGICLLQSSGRAESSARSLLAKWKNAHGSAAVIEALGAAQRQGAIDPVSFIEGRWRANGGATRQPAVPL